MLRSGLIAICALLVALPHAAIAQAAPAERPRVGLVLSGGGARGLAHVGVLKLLEREHVPVDVITGTSMGVNVGVNKVRFPSPVPVGSLVRGTAEVMSVDEVGGGTQAVVRVSVTVDGAPKPSCVVDTVSRFFP